MTVRSVREVMEALWDVCGSDPEALALVERFRGDAIFLSWDEARPLPPAGQFIDISEKDLSPGDILVYCVRPSEGVRKDPLAWIGRAHNTEDDDAYRVLYIDATPCHPDWFGLKLFSEICFLYELITKDEIVDNVHSLPVSTQGDPGQALLHSAILYLMDCRRKLTYRVLDAKMGGRISDKVRPFRRNLPAPAMLDTFAENLSKDLCQLLEKVWVRSRNRDEQNARTAIARIATLGAMKVLLGSQRLSH